MPKRAATQPQDGALIALALAGRADCFTVLMDRHLATVRKRIGKLVRNAAEAEDLLQDVLLKVWIHLSTFRSESSFRTWMTRIAINEALQSFRRDRSRRIAYGTYDFDELPSPSESPCQSLANREKTQTLRNAVATLPPDYRQVLILRDFEELSEKETALSLHLSLASVKTRLRRARLMVRARVASASAIDARRVGNNDWTQKGRVKPVTAAQSDIVLLAEHAISA
jgi:RNA polymerase sigma-70 factor (ECF subfamily)